MFFLLGCQKHCYLQCFVHLGSKKYWYLQHFLRFCMAPAKDVKTQKCCNLQHFVHFEKRKIVRKMCQNGTFFPILGTLKTGGRGAFCSWRRLWATRIPSKNLSPTLLKDFWCFSGPGVGGSAAWGAPHLRALVALGRSWGKPLVGSRRWGKAHMGSGYDFNLLMYLRADAPRRLRRISRPSISSQCGLESFWTGTCFRNIFLMFFENWKKVME